MTARQYNSVIQTLKVAFRDENPPAFPRSHLDKATGQIGYSRTFANLMSDKAVQLPEGIVFRKGRKIYVVRDVFADWYFDQFTPVKEWNQ